MAGMNELSEFVTCGVCLCEFDAEIKKPKFLPCSHTVCLVCLKEICRLGLITCPFCRNTSTQFDANNLPNNSYALHMLTFKVKKVEQHPAPIANPQQGLSWCFTCGTMTKASCAQAKHSSVNMTAGTVKNLEAFLSLKEELQAMKNSGTDKLAMAIQKRKEIQEHLDLLIKLFTANMEEIQEFQDENNLVMTEMISTLEGNSLQCSPVTEEDEKETKDFFLTELLSIVDDSSVDDTAETLKEKLKKSVEMCEQNLQQATSTASEYELSKKMRIKVNLFDEDDRPIPTCKWFDDGFRLMKKDGSDGLDNTAGALIRQDLKLLSHAVFSLLRRKKVNLKQASASVSQSDTSNENVLVPDFLPANTKGKKVFTLIDSNSLNCLPSTSSVVQQQTSVLTTCIPTPMVLSTNFFLGESIFVMRLAQRGITRGEIHIQPVATFHPQFTIMLGDFCFKSPKVFCLNNVKAVHGVFALFPMAHPQFQPNLPSIIAKFPLPLSGNDIAERPLDVGVNSITTSGNLVTGWNFVFPQENYRVPKYSMHLKSFPAARLFGRVINEYMLEGVTKLSSISNSERSGYTLTLESR